MVCHRNMTKIFLSDTIFCTHNEDRSQKCRGMLNSIDNYQEKTQYQLVQRSHERLLVNGNLWHSDLGFKELVIRDERIHNSPVSPQSHIICQKF